MTTKQEQAELRAERLRPLTTGRTAFISGASRGIGAALAERAAELGMKLVLCSRSAPVLPESDDVLSRQADVRDAEALDAIVAEAESRFGKIDVWINNAGVLDPIAKVREIDAEAFRQHIDINLWGVFLGAKAYVGHLRRRLAERSAGSEFGVLLNMSSGAAWNAYEGWGPYCASKAGVARLSEVLALEEAEIGLRVHSVAPGIVDTDMQSLIRATPAERFPAVAKFEEFKEQEAFNGPVYVADEFLAIAFDPARRPAEVDYRLENEA